MNRSKQTKSQLIEEIERLEQERKDYGALEHRLRETEEALYKSKAMFQIVIDNIPQYIFWKDRNHIYQGCNRLFAEGAGVGTPSNIAGKTDYDLAWTKEEADFYRNVDRQVMDSNKPELNFVETQKQSDGKELIINTNKMPLTDKQGNVIGILGTYEDITDKNRAEEELKESQKKYKMLVDHSLVGIYITQDHILKFSNQKLAEFFGYDRPEELIGRHIREIVDPDSWEMVDKEVRMRQTHQKEASRYEFTGIRKDGSKIYLEVLGISIEMDGNPAVQGTLIDITERRKFENALMESEEKFRLISDQSLMTIIIIQDSRIKYTNSAFADLLEDSLESVNNYTVREISDALHPDDRDFVLDQMQKKETGEDGTIPHYSFRIITKTGKQRWVDLYSKTIYFNGRTADLATMIDISDRVQAQQEIKALNEELEQIVIDRTSQLQEALEEYRYENYERKRTQDELYIAKERLEESLIKEKELNELKSRFISMVSHEYRTPLTAIYSTTYILEKYLQLNKKDDILKQIDKIRHSVQDMTRLLEDVLTIGRTESDNMDIEPMELDIIEVCKDVLEENRVIDKSDHRFTLMSDSNSLLMRTDRTHIYHILSNLVSNAAKYSPKNSEVKLIVMDEIENVTIKVIDAGIGIPEKEIGKVFEPFYRLQNVGTIPGTGLGLSIVKKCVDNLRGEITFSSKINKGSTFKIILPKNYVKLDKK